MSAETITARLVPQGYKPSVFDHLLQVPESYRARMSAPVSIQPFRRHRKAPAKATAENSIVSNVAGAKMMIAKVRTRPNGSP